MLTQSTVDLRDYLQAVCRSWYFIVPLVLMGAGGAFVASRLSDPVFDAASEIVIDRPETPVVGKDLQSRITWDETFVLTQLRILESDLMIGRAASQLLARCQSPGGAPPRSDLRRTENPAGPWGLIQRVMSRAQPPTLLEFLHGQTLDSTKNKIKANSSVSLVSRSRVFRMQASSMCPEFSALAADLRASEYATYVSETYASRAQKTFQMLKKQSDEATLRLRESADELVELKRKARIQALTGDATGEDKASAAEGLPPGLRETVAKSSPEILPLQDQLAETESDIARLSGRYLGKHPQMMGLVAKRDLLRGQIERLKDRACAEWIGRHRDERARVEFTLREQDLAISRKMQEMLLEKIKEIDFIGDSPSLTVRVLQTASVPRKASSPKTPKNVALGSLSGLVAGLFLAFLRAHAQASVVSSRTPLAQLPAPITATIPHIPNRTAVMDVQSGRDSSSVVAEAFKSLRTAVDAALKAAGGRTVLLTSPESGDGKSLISLGLAQSFASLSVRVLLVDADMRRGRLREAFTLEPGAGLSDIISGRDDVVPIQVAENLHLIQSGSKTTRPSELLVNPRLSVFMGWAALNYDLVIVDAPPLLAVTDASLLASHATLRYIVLREKRTHLEIAGLAANVLHSLGYDLSGVVLNDMVPDGRRYGYGYRYGYRYGYSSG